MQIIPIPAPSSSVRARLLALLDEGSRWLFLRARAGFDKSLTVRAWLHADPRLLESAQWIQLAPGDRVDIVRLGGLLAGRRRPRIVVLDATTSDVPLDIEALRAVGAFPELLPEPVSPVALTEREGVVLRALATGSDIGTIARTLFVSENTVRMQVRAVYRKLGVHSRDQAVAEAVRRGIVR